MRVSFAMMFFILFGLTTCAPFKPVNPKKNFVDTLKRTTVALVIPDLDDLQDKMMPYCSGVWVGSDKILTAEHCVDDKKIDNVVMYIDIGDRKGKIKIAHILQSDPVQDLALLIALNPPEHPVALLTEEVWDGQHVNIVGHTNGLWWTFIEGVVSASRYNFKKETKHIQISSPAWMGNSGGGAFDDEGKLVGICSYVMPGSPLLSFFIHKDKIKSFMEKSSPRSSE